MLKGKLTSILATAILLSLGHYAHAAETQDYLIQKAADLCGHDGEITYLECITEDSSRIAGDPDFFALIKKMCGTDTQIKKCLKETFAETTPEASETSNESINSENITAASNISNAIEAKKEIVKADASSVGSMQTSISAAYATPLAKKVVVTTTSGNELQAVTNITNTIYAAPSKPVVASVVNSQAAAYSPKTTSKIPPLTFAQPEKPKKKCSQHPRAAAYAHVASSK